MISDEDVERAVHYLADSARKAAKARAARVHLTDYTKHLRATIMREHADKTVNAQEREAEADPRYKMHLEAITIAVEEDAYCTFMREAASAKLECWRTQSSNERAKL